MLNKPAYNFKTDKATRNIVRQIHSTLSCTCNKGKKKKFDGAQTREIVQNPDYVRGKGGRYCPAQ